MDEKVTFSPEKLWEQKLDHKDQSHILGSCIISNKDGAQHTVAISVSIGKEKHEIIRDICPNKTSSVDITVPYSKSHSTCVQNAHIEFLVDGKKVKEVDWEVILWSPYYFEEGHLNEIPHLIIPDSDYVKELVRGIGIRNPKDSAQVREAFSKLSELTGSIHVDDRMIYRPDYYEPFDECDLVPFYYIKPPSQIKGTGKASRLDYVCLVAAVFEAMGAEPILVYSEKEMPFVRVKAADSKEPVSLQFDWNVPGTKGDISELSIAAYRDKGVLPLKDGYVLETQFSY